MMKFYWIKTNLLIKKIFRNYVWDIPNTTNKIYLTFDDGPTPEITEWVLKELQKYNAKATFFCIGNNIEKYPDIFETCSNSIPVPVRKTSSAFRRKSGRGPCFRLSARLA